MGIIVTFQCLSYVQRNLSFAFTLDIVEELFVNIKIKKGLRLVLI